MAIHILAALHKFSKKKETKIEKEKVEITLSDCIKKTVKNRSDETLGFELLFVG